MIQILDCTMRDGGYYNDWDFSPEFVSDYLNLMHELGTTHVELGFRFLKSQSHVGPWAYTPDSLVASHLVPKDLKIGVMANLGELIDASDSVLEQIFAKSVLVNFVRLACHFEELEHLPKVVRFIVAQGFSVGVNLMQVSERSPGQLAAFAKIINSLPVDFAYVADSLGALKPEDAERIALDLSSSLSMPFGIHAHDNRGLALQNTLAAMRSGATMLDCTLGGMGRGAGNTRTEDLLAELSSTGEIPFNSDAFAPLHEFLNRHMAPMMSEHKWGASLPYRLAADWGIHPTFVQELLRGSTDHRGVINSLQSLSVQSSSRFNPKMLPFGAKDEEVQSTSVGEAFSSARKKNVLIIGGGLTASLHSRQLQEFGAEENVTLLLLNQAWPDVSGTPNTFRIGANRMRMGANTDEFWRSDNSIVSPLLPPEKAPAGPQSSVIPLKVCSGVLDWRDGVALVPNELTFSYALALAIFLEAGTVFLAGIDGYEDGDIRNSEIMESLSVFKTRRPDVNLISLTSTKLPVANKSPYWRG
jgi:4-hydroxy 2-oxovalerate aldolase